MDSSLVQAKRPPSAKPNDPIYSFAGTNTHLDFKLLLFASNEIKALAITVQAAAEQQKRRRYDPMRPFLRLM
jgi:hypothetical protein